MIRVNEIIFHLLTLIALGCLDWNLQPEIIIFDGFYLALKPKTSNVSESDHVAVGTDYRHCNIFVSVIVIEGHRG